METPEVNKELNIINLLICNIVNRFDDLESKGLIFRKPKQAGKVFIRELEKVSNNICEVGKNTDPEIYKQGVNQLHKYNDKLDEILEALYNIEL